MSVDHDRRVRQVPVKDELQHPAHVGHLVRGERCFPENARESGNFEQTILLAKGYAKDFAQSEHRLPAWLGAAGFNKTDMPRRETSPARQLKLAQPTCFPPRTKLWPE